MNKLTIIRHIISRIKSSLPSSCPICCKEYRLELNKVALFTCFRCQRASHDCQAYLDFRNALPNGLLKGFVWFCSECEDGDSVDPKLVDEGKRTATVAQTTDSRSVNVGLQSSSQQNEIEPQEVIKNSAENESSDTRTNEPIVCPEYKKSSCPHGIRGNKLINGAKCMYLHPKLCQKYCGYGSKGEYGCKAGRSCPYFHPRLCRFSMSKKLCTKQDCKFVHLKGTARKVQNNKPSTDKNEYGEDERTKEGSSKSESKPRVNNANRDFLEVMHRKFEELSKKMNRRILELHQAIQVPQNYNPYQTANYQALPMMGYPFHPQQFHAMPTQPPQTGRTDTLPPNLVPSFY